MASTQLNFAFVTLVSMSLIQWKPYMCLTKTPATSLRVEAPWVECNLAKATVRKAMAYFDHKSLYDLPGSSFPEYSMFTRGFSDPGISISWECKGDRTIGLPRQSILILINCVDRSWYCLDNVWPQDFHDPLAGQLTYIGTCSPQELSFVELFL